MWPVLLFFLKEFMALFYWYIELFTRKILNIHSWIISCPDGITPNSGLTGPRILTIYIYIYIYESKYGSKSDSMKKNKYQIYSYLTSNMDDFKMICIYENLLVFAYFLINERIYLVSLGKRFQIYFHVPDTFLTHLNYERYVHVCTFPLYTFHLLLLSQHASIAMWTILISKSWWWLLKLKCST